MQPEAYFFTAVLAAGGTLEDLLPESLLRTLNVAAGGLVGGLVMLAIAAVFWGLRWGINNGVDSVAALFGRGLKAKSARPAIATAAAAPAPAVKFQPSRTILMASGFVLVAIAIGSGIYAIGQWSADQKQLSEQRGAPAEDARNNYCVDWDQNSHFVDVCKRRILDVDPSFFDTVKKSKN